MGGKFRDLSMSHENNEKWHPTKITAIRYVPVHEKRRLSQCTACDAENNITTPYVLRTAKHGVHSHNNTVNKQFIVSKTGLDIQ